MSEDMNLNEIPDIKEELERKTFQTLETLISNHENGKITTIEYRASINTLFSVCSGLVDGGFFELISAASEEIKKDFSLARTRVFKKQDSDKVKVITRIKNKGEFIVAVYNCTLDGKKILRGVCDHTDTNEETEEKVKMLTNSLKASGYAEIVSKG